MCQRDSLEWPTHARFTEISTKKTVQYKLGSKGLQEIRRNQGGIQTSRWLYIFLGSDLQLGKNTFFHILYMHYSEKIVILMEFIPVSLTNQQ